MKNEALSSNSIIRSFAILALVLVLVGCAHDQSHVSSYPQAWPSVLSEAETARFKEVAWDAADSREIWEQFKFERLTAAPVKLNPSHIEYYLDAKQFDRVEVAIPSGGRLGRHSCFIGVTVARGTYKVLGIREGVWW